MSNPEPYRSRGVSPTSACRPEASRVASSLCKGARGPCIPYGRSVRPLWGPHSMWNRRVVLERTGESWSGEPTATRGSRATRGNNGPSRGTTCRLRKGQDLVRETAFGPQSRPWPPRKTWLPCSGAHGAWANILRQHLSPLLSL